MDLNRSGAANFYEIWKGGRKCKASVVGALPHSGRLRDVQGILLTRSLIREVIGNLTGFVAVS